MTTHHHGDRIDTSMMMLPTPIVETNKVSG